MKAFVILAIGFVISTNTHANSKKHCLNACRDIHSSCQTEVQDWTDDQYIALEGSEQYLKNKTLNDLLDKVDAERKAMKKVCKDALKECKASCEDK